MPIKIIKNIESNRIVKVILFILLSPFIAMFLTLILKTLFNLGTYLGTFLRFLFDIVVY